MLHGSLSKVLRSPYARVATAILLVQAAAFYYAFRGEAKVALAQPLEQFPTSAGTWQVASVGVVEPEVQEILKADDTLTRWYVSPIGGANLFVAFFKTQRTGQSPHSPKNCLPGSGWVPSTTGAIDVSIPNTSETIRINHYVVSKGENRSVVLYWYQTEKRVIADEFAAKFYLVADSIRYHHSDTSLVRVVVPVVRKDDAAATAQGVAFVQAIYPQLKTYLPH